MEKSWLLVEWIQKDILCPSFDVVNSKCLEGKQDVCVGKLSILREKYSNNTRPGKVLFISDNKQLLKTMKSMLVNMKEQMRKTMEMFNSTMEQMKTELMEECQRLNTKTPGTIKGDFDTQKIGKTKSTEQRYSPKYIAKLRNSLTKGYEEITALMLALKEDPVNGDSQEPKEQTANRIVIASKKSKRDTEDDCTANFGPIKKKIRAWNEQKGAMKKDNSIIAMEPKGTPKASTTSMRQYINRKVLSAVHNVNDMESNTHITNQRLKNNNGLNVTKISTKDCNEDELIKNISIIHNNLEPDAEGNTRLSLKSHNGTSPAENDEFKINKTNKKTVYNTKENADNVNHDNNNTYSFSDNNEINPDNAMDSTQEEMVPIGNGNTLIPKRVYENLNWNSYTNATRKLLQILFSREILSTHSLSGKQSPAFSNKPAKKQLNPITVDDIVTTVSKKCDIKESFVRTCITIKCADEAKMLRQRTSRNRSVHDENLPIPKK